MNHAIEKISHKAPGGAYNVVVETPRGSRAKFAYDVETGLFRAKKLLPLGFAFPFAFGFFPSTQADDGDPLDVLLLTDVDLPTGCLVRCQPIGGIAMEQNSGNETLRNDRLLAVPLLRHQDRPPHELSELPAAELRDLENFLLAYKVADGKSVKVVGRLSASEAKVTIATAARRVGGAKS